MKMKKERPLMQREKGEKKVIKLKDVEKEGRREEGKR